jgi:hypothetical protein
MPFKPEEHEAVHKIFIKRVLEVCPSTPDLVMYREVARLPFASFRLQMNVKYWNRLCGMANNRLLQKSFLENFALGCGRSHPGARHYNPIWHLSDLSYRMTHSHLAPTL